MGDEGYILLAVLIGAYILIMPLIAFITAKGASKKIKHLQSEVEMLKIQTERQGKPETPKPDNCPSRNISHAIPVPVRGQYKME